MTEPGSVPPAERNTDVLVQMLYDGLHGSTCADHGPHCDQFKPQLRDAIRVGLNRLAAAGYRIVKANPTVADLAAEQGVTPFDPATFGTFDPLLTEQERDGLLSALEELHNDGMAVWTEWGVHYEKGVTEHNNEESARVFAEVHGRPLMRRQRGVGPWLPVTEIPPGGTST
jgi:hypothetical protein